MNAYRRYRLWSETKNIIACGTADSMNIIFVLVPLAPKSHRGHAERPPGFSQHAVDKWHSVERGACQIHPFQSKSALCPGKKLYLIAQGCFLQTQPEKWPQLIAFRASHPLRTWQEDAGIFRASSNNCLCLLFYMLTCHFLIDL